MNEWYLVANNFRTAFDLIFKHFHVWPIKIYIKKILYKTLCGSILKKKTKYNIFKNRNPITTLFHLCLMMLIRYPPANGIFLINKR